MINPKWLSGAYIVENTALDYDSEDAFGLSTKPTNIKATRYRDFVSQYPARTSYFQPVIEKLEYVTPELLGKAPFVIVEGITDYYALRLAKELEGLTTPFALMPGAGAGSSGPLISLLLGRGERFLILLDDDESGRQAALRYREEWYLPATSVQTLADLDPKLSGMRLENLISSATRNLIKTKYASPRNLTKKVIGLYLAETCAIGGDQTSFSPETKEKLLSVLRHLTARF